jgi:hypothetical protein
MALSPPYRKMSVEETFLKVLRCLDNARPVTPSELGVDDVPTDRGVYIWYTLDQSSPAYIGKATGKTGLRGRVLRQHLNANYLETRASKITPKDQSQLSHGIFLNGKPAIEKSAFRKHLARSHDLAPGEPTVEFIKANFSVQLIPLPGLTDDEIRFVENKLVQALRPKLNVIGNRSIR